MANTLYQTVNFHFSVKFSLPGDHKVTDDDIKFQSVTGLDTSIETENIKEGGENTFEHVIPTRVKSGPIVLKRGILKPEHSGITTWFKKAVDSLLITPLKEITISLLDEDHQPLMVWVATNVWPRSWKIGELNAERGEVLLETLELNCNTITFKDK